MNNTTKKAILKNFCCLAFPSLLWIISLCILIFVVSTPSEIDREIIGSFYEFYIYAAEEIASSFNGGTGLFISFIICVIACVIFFPSL